METGPSPKYLDANWTARATGFLTFPLLQQALRSFKVTMSVDPKFHPKIIGRKGAVISQIRKEHDVSIQFPDKGDEEQVGGWVRL